MSIRCIPFLLMISWTVLFCWTGLLVAEETSSPMQRATELQNFYKSLTSITFDFTQNTRVGGRDRTGSGTAVFVKTGNSENHRSIMRWNYNEPDRQIIINDGTTLTIYTDKDRQLIKTSSRDLESDITYAFFAGTRDLLEDFQAMPADSDVILSSAEELQAIKLVPRQPHNQIRDVIVWADKGNIIRHMFIEDHFDAVTQLNFTNISLNSIQPTDTKKINAITSFDVPPGTEIITQ